MEYRGDTGDPYVDSQTGVLNNLAGIKDASQLEAFEVEMSIQRQVELSEALPPLVFDYAHLKAIHRYLFQDVYSWAGQPRSVDMAKGSSRFGSHLHLETYLSKRFAELAVERRRWSAAPETIEWADRLAHYLGEINAANPFREGNGRVQRFFIGQLAEEHGFEVRWEDMTASEMVDASIASFQGDNRPMWNLIERNLVRQDAGL